MKLAVFDTHVRRPDGRLMHFDILVRDEPAARDMAVVLAHGRLYLAAKGVPSEALQAQECRFCHTEFAPAAFQAEVERQGFAIIEMAHCD